eukprot:2334270-Ditylum_brightwellii.AAC.1
MDQEQQITSDQEPIVPSPIDHEPSNSTDQQPEETYENATDVDTEQVDKVNDELFIPEDEHRSSLIAINGYQWKESSLLRYLLPTKETQWVNL